MSATPNIRGEKIFGSITGITLFSATTISGGTFYGNGSNLTGIVGGSGSTITGGTFDKNTSTLTFTNTTGGTFSVTGLTDVYITGGTYDNNVGVVTFTNTSGGTFDVSGFSSGSGGEFLPLSGGTVSGFTQFQSGVTINSLTSTTITNTYLDNFYIRDTLGIVSINNNGRELRKSNGIDISFDWENGILTGQTNIQSTTISATTYSNLPQDIFVTGGTYSNGTTTFTNNTGGTFNVSGFFTGYTNVVNSVTTGIGLSADTTIGDVTIINTAPDQVVTLSGGTNISITGTYPNFSISFSGSTTSTFDYGITYAIANNQQWF